MNFRSATAVWPSFVSFLVTVVVFSVVNEPSVVHDETKRTSSKIGEKILPDPEPEVKRFLVFIGGVPKSGTTLMRTMMDQHPDIRCGQETFVIPDLLNNHQAWITDDFSAERLKNAGLLPNVLDEAIVKFVSEIITHHGPEANVLCNTDSMNLAHSAYLHQVFPKAKFILMIRDGRAVAHSIVEKRFLIAGCDVSSYRDVLAMWNQTSGIMYDKCLELGEAFCHVQYYEQLVLQPVKETKALFKFLDMPWSERVLHHYEHTNNISQHISLSADKVETMLSLETLWSWFGHIPPDVERDMAKIAPMLSVLGYNPYNPTPTYGKPDEFVLNTMKGRN